MTIRARLLAILKEPDCVTFQNFVREPGDCRNIFVEDWCARHRLKRMCEEIAEMPIMLDLQPPGTGPFTRESKVLEKYRAAILAIGDDNEHS